DFSEWTDVGVYALHIPGLSLQTTSFQIANRLFSETTLLPASIEQLDHKIDGKMGWQDCGSDLRAVEGHALQLFGLVDCYESFRETMSDEQQQRFMAHIRRGADYLSICQREDGSYMNEYYVAKEKR